MALADIVDDRARHALLVVVTLVVSFLAEDAARGESLVAPIWPAAGVMAGTLLLVPWSRTVLWLAVWLPGIVVVHLARRCGAARSGGMGVACVLESWVVRRLLRPEGGGVPALLDDGDVSRTVRAIAAGAATAAAGYAAVNALAGGRPRPHRGRGPRHPRRCADGPAAAVPAHPDVPRAGLGPGAGRPVGAGPDHHRGGLRELRRPAAASSSSCRCSPGSASGAPCARPRCC